MTERGSVYREKTPSQPATQRETEPQLYGKQQDIGSTSASEEEEHVRVEEPRVIHAPLTRSESESELPHPERTHAGLGLAPGTDKPILR